MRFETFSRKQLTALTWWCENSPHHMCDAVICDGAVRSGKTMSLSLSFLLWSMTAFRDRAFGLCGKTLLSLRRNVVAPLAGVLRGFGFHVRDNISRNTLEVSFGGNSNRYHLFGGKDEGSAPLIQGVTLAGVLFDEVALMPRSFVEQALARCSVEGARYFFSCNPEHPAHWFYEEWIQKARERRALYLHFRMEDNPSLSETVRNRYEALYTGAFYDRFVLGKWSAAHGAVYPMFSRAAHVVDTVPECGRHIISCDYGTVNPASFGLWGLSGGVWYRLREYYYDSRKQGGQRTDSEHADALEALAGGIAVEAVVVDPSAASFMQCLRRRGKYTVIPADNGVADGIRTVSDALRSGRLRFHESCRDCIREFSLYRWNLGAQGDVPCKENDHAMDDVRYFAVHVFSDGAADGFFAVAADRRTRELF